jgi:hypothetical protein
MIYETLQYDPCSTPSSLGAVHGLGCVYSTHSPMITITTLGTNYSSTVHVSSEVNLTYTARDAAPSVPREREGVE